jgi:hypothetical protein
MAWRSLVVAGLLVGEAVWAQLDPIAALRRD